MPDDDPSPWSTHAPTQPPAHPGAYVPDTWSAASAYGPSHPAQTALNPYGPPHPAHAYAGPPLEVRVATPPAAGRGLSYLGVVLGGLALLGVLLTVVFLFASSAVDDLDGGGGHYAPMRGSVAPAAGGTALTGDALASRVTQTVRDDGGYPEGITCPATPTVAQDVTTVCHGRDDGVESAFVVFFEDAGGSYTLLEL